MRRAFSPTAFTTRPFGETLVDGDIGLPDLEQLEQLEAGSRDGRSRRALAVILLLLLLLCAVTTVVDVWVTAPTATQQQAILSNIECLRCHVEMMPLFTKASVHSPFLKKQCTTCHSPHGEIVRTTQTFGPIERWQRLRTLLEWLPLRLACEIGKGPLDYLGQLSGVKTQTTEKQTKGADSKTTLPADELCWMCHGNIGPQRSMAFTHNPFMKGRCTTCHDPHASDFGPLLTQSEQDLCVTCHPIGPQLNRAQVHPPVASRYCTTCHHPHASEYRGILVSNQRDLCFTCHPTVAPLSLKAVQHEPFLDNCTGCHEPHGSNYLPLLRKDQPPLCYDCHPGIRTDFLKPSRHPIEAGQLDCAGCHDPHAADFQFLLTAKDNEFCYRCHATVNGASPAIKPTYDPSGHGTGNVLCIRCHTPHGSYIAPLLRNTNPELCLECHAPQVDGPNKHPFRPTIWDVVANKPLTCTTTCHNPHGTDQNFMLQRFSYPFDGQCLQCHQVVVGKRVGIDF
jgi:predicted CXXCH cytochrome family protein